MDGNCGAINLGRRIGGSGDDDNQIEFTLSIRSRARLAYRRRLPPIILENSARRISDAVH